MYHEDSPAPDSNPKTLPPLPLWPPAKFLKHEPDSSAVLLGEGYLEKGEWTSLLGVGGLGKTRISLWLCICQILGRKFLGIPTHGGPQKCLLLSTESGLRRWKEDLSRMLPTFTDNERAVLDAHLRILALIPGDACDMHLSNVDSITRLRLTLQTEHPGIVVFDPFQDMIIGDENATQDVTNTLRCLRQIHHDTAPDSAVLIIHHARTGSSNVAQAGDLFSSGNFGRGSKALFSKIRCEIQFAPGSRDDPNRIFMACGKANNAERFAPRGVLFNPQTFIYSLDPDFDLETWRTALAGKARRESVSVADVINVVREFCPHPGTYVRTRTICDEVEAATGACTRSIKSRLREAVVNCYLRKGPKLGEYTLGSKPYKEGQ